MRSQIDENTQSFVALMSFVAGELAVLVARERVEWTCIGSSDFGSFPELVEVSHWSSVVARRYPSGIPS